MLWAAYPDRVPWRCVRAPYNSFVIERDPSPPYRGRRRGNVTVTSIAQLAGVSPPTVSKVLNGRPGVGEDTRQRVEALLRANGYRGPGATTTTASLEVIFCGILSHIAIEMMRGIEDVAGSRGLSVGFTDVRREMATGRAWAQAILARRPVGMIAALLHAATPDRQVLESSGIPLVALDPRGDLHPMTSVGSTNWTGGLTATRHLLDLGHRRIGVITGPTRDLSSRARLDGFRAALDTAGIPFDAGLARGGRFLFEHGRDLGLDLLRLPDPPTGVVCGDDLQALGLYEAARLTGLRIPDDLSVVGFDDIEYCQWCGPALTTVRQPFAEMGATAARLVLALADGEAPAQIRFELATTLVVRGSTAPPNAARYPRHPQ